MKYYSLYICHDLYITDIVFLVNWWCMKIPFSIKVKPKSNLTYNCFCLAISLSSIDQNTQIEPIYNENHGNIMHRFDLHSDDLNCRNLNYYITNQCHRQRRFMTRLSPETRSPWKKWSKREANEEWIQSSSKKMKDQCVLPK